MTDGGSGAVFWSYAHEDDRLDSGLIAGLAQRLVAEYSLITGGDLKLFIDRDISWGEEWRRRIDGALTETTFFIPVLTPRYFTRPECRREMIAFHGNVSSLGVGELLLPILYASVADFTSENSDELVAIASRYQCVDWTQLRLDGADAPSYRKAVHNLARRLVEVGAEIAERQIGRETAVLDGESTDLLGIGDVAQAIEPLLPNWLEAMESAEIGSDQHDVIWKKYGPRLYALERGGPGQAGARFAILQRCAKEDRPIGEHQLANAKEYSRTALELEPLVTQALRMSNDIPEAIGDFESLWQALDRAAEGMARDRRLREDVNAVTTAEWYTERAHLSQLARQVAGIYNTTMTLIDQTNDLVASWITERDRIFASAEAERNATDSAP